MWVGCACRDAPTTRWRAGVFYIGNGHMLVTFARPDAWQIGYILPKGDFAAVRERGLDAFRDSITELVPAFGDRTATIAAWHDVHLLSVKSDLLPRWHYPGLLYIGDAAHVMSPVFGVGINYAIADAVELVNALTDDLLRGDAPEAALAGCNACASGRRGSIQRMQSVVQRRIVAARVDRPRVRLAVHCQDGTADTRSARRARADHRLGIQTGSARCRVIDWPYRAAMMGFVKVRLGSMRTARRGGHDRASSQTELRHDPRDHGERHSLFQRHSVRGAAGG